MKIKISVPVKDSLDHGFGVAFPMIAAVNLRHGRQTATEMSAMPPLLNHAHRFRFNREVAGISLLKPVVGIPASARLS